MTEGENVMHCFDRTIRLAAVQAAPFFLDQERTLQKACDLIREAGRNNADVVGFPEGFIPGHPGWQELIPATSELALTLSCKLFKHAVVVPGPCTTALSAACRDAGVIAVIGVNERRADTTGSLFNTQLFFGRDGALLHKHQKIVPTIGERVVHTPGTTGRKAAIKTDIGTVSGLLCGENANPLLQYAVGLDYPIVHVASWPSHFGPGLALDGLGMQETISVITRGLAYSLKCFLINSVAAMDDSIVDAYGVDPAANAFLKKGSNHGGTCILGPGGNVIAGPLPPGESILYADVRTDDVIIPKFIHDFAGHYNRPELFATMVNDMEIGRVQVEMVARSDSEQARSGFSLPNHEAEGN
jgi:aliphatic nitrilase